MLKVHISYICFVQVQWCRVQCAETQLHAHDGAEPGTLPGVYFLFLIHGFSLLVFGCMGIGIGTIGWILGVRCNVKCTDAA